MASINKSGWLCVHSQWHCSSTIFPGHSLEMTGQKIEVLIHKWKDFKTWDLNSDQYIPMNCNDCLCEKSSLICIKFHCWSCLVTSYQSQTRPGWVWSRDNDASQPARSRSPGVKLSTFIFTHLSQNNCKLLGHICHDFIHDKEPQN